MSDDTGAMNTLAQHDPCVCVHSASETSGSLSNCHDKSQDGTVCESTYTRAQSTEHAATTTVASQSASSVVGTTHESTSTLLALYRVIDND